LLERQALAGRPSAQAWAERGWAQAWVGRGDVGGAEQRSRGVGARSALRTS